MNSMAIDKRSRSGETPVSESPVTNHQSRFLRLIACGSVDDGKSTLIGRLLHEAGQHAEAERHYRDALKLRDHALAAFNLGVLLEDMQRPAEAISAYGRALAADPQLAEAHYNLAQLYEKRGDRMAAIRHFNGYRALTRPT